jgi:membrane protease YdiL (CAAX protease family)
VPTLAPKPQALLGRFFKKAFVGPGGIRAGWRLSIFLAIFVGLIAMLSFTARTLSHTRPSPVTVLEPRSMLNNEAVAFLVLLFASWVMSRIEHRCIADYGLPLRGTFRTRFWQRVLIGFATMTVLLGSMRLAGVFRFGTIGLRGVGAFEYAALWGVVFLFVGLFEEFFFRGYALFTLTTGMTFWPSAIMSSALFGLLHYGTAGESQVGALEAGLTSLIFSFILRRTGDLWIPIGFHAAWDWGLTYFYSVPDSGYAAKGHLFNPTFTGPAWLTRGTAGPEGSWLCIALLVILWIGLALWLRGKRYPNPG